jgi:hypothetical protein
LRRSKSGRSQRAAPQHDLRNLVLAAIVRLPDIDVRIGHYSFEGKGA